MAQSAYTILAYTDYASISFKSATVDLCFKVNVVITSVLNRCTGFSALTLNHNHNHNFRYSYIGMLKHQAIMLAYNRQPSSTIIATAPRGPTRFRITSMTLGIKWNHYSGINVILESGIKTLTISYSCKF